MKVTILASLIAFVLVVASLVNYSFFVQNRAVTKNLESNSSVIQNIAGNSTTYDASLAVWLIPIIGLALFLIPLGDIEKDDDFDYWATPTAGIKGGVSEKESVS